MSENPVTYHGRGLSISADFSLPIETVTQAIGVIAKRRAGKSYLIMKLVEQLFAARQQVVILDPKGDSWGLRFGADGKSPGLPIVIIGGEHGDVKLEPSAGEVVARLVVEDRVNALVDLSELRKHEVATFATAFLETLYRLKAREQYRTAMMLVVDEADAIAPQRPQRGEERMLGAAEDIVRRGGQRGIGCIMATQRAAVLNKNVLTQVQILVALRTIAPQDLEAMNAWVDVHGSTEQRRQLMQSLPSLPVGSAWFWSPGWPSERGIFERVQVGKRETYDSGATPKAGEHRSEPKRAAEVDLGALTAKMAATIERAKADDPKELRKRIAELEREAKAKAAAPAAKVERVETKTVELRLPGFDPKTLKRLEALLDRLELVGGQVADLAAPLREQAATIRSIIDHAAAEAQDTKAALARAAGARQVPPVSGARAPVVPPSRGTGTPPVRTGASRPTAPSSNDPRGRILRSFAWWRAAGIDEPTRPQLAFGARYSVNGHFNNVVGSMRTEGTVEYPGPNRLRLTSEGWALAPAIDTAPTRAELVDMVREQLRQAPLVRVFDALAEAGGPISRADLAAGAGYSVNGHFNNVVGRLHTLGLADYPSPGMIALSAIFAELP